MISITELAEHIVLDDVTDTFYRTLCFSNFSRSDLEPKHSLEKKLDDVISNKLSRLLNWSSSVCSLENATHKLTHLLSTFMQGKLTAAELERQLDENYWLSAALNQQMSAQDLVDLYSSNSGKVDTRLNDVVFQYFLLQLNEPYTHLAEQAQLFSQVIVELAQEEEPSVDFSELQHLAFLNIYPFVVLLMLLDKTVQSAKQELLNQIGFECEQSREVVKQYQPCGETVLSFLVFDEFVKYHIHDAMLGKVSSNLLMDEDSSIEAVKQAFLRARTRAVLNSLAHIPVLTPEQKLNFSKQLGIKAEVKYEISDAFATLVKRLMPSKFEYNVSLPV